MAKKKKKLLFNPDHAATQLSQDISRDLSTQTLAYKGMDETQKFYKKVQISSTLKKYVHEDKERIDELTQKTFEKFLHVNSHMAGFRGITLPAQQRITSSIPQRDRILLRAKAMFKAILTPFTEDELFLEAKNSSGTSQGVSYNDTSEEAKFSFPLSCSALCYPLFMRYLRHDPVLAEAIETFNSRNPIQGAIIVIKESTRATTVEKNNDIRRMIGIERTVDMFFQQALMSIFYNRMKNYGLDITKLPHLHQQLARISSLTGKNATVDWSSASDCSAIDYVRWITPPDYLYVMECTRSKYVLINEERHELNMYSTMGNAVTFPLESLIFWTLMQSCHNENVYTNSYIPVDKSACSIFGDDCILPVEDVDLFLKITTSIGYMVNEEKSFVDDCGFRESCGGDYYRGYDVRPFHIRAPQQRKNSALEPWLYTICNKILTKYITYFGSLTYIYDKHVFKTIFSLFGRLGKAVKLVPSYYPDDAGLKWSFDLQRLHACYDISFAPISLSDQGIYSFTYCNFRYTERKDKDDFLRYALWLRNPRVTNWWSPRIGEKPSYSCIDQKLIRSALKDQRDLLKSKATMTQKLRTRKIGGYVVAKGIASNWHVPVIVNN